MNGQPLHRCITIVWLRWVLAGMLIWASHVSAQDNPSPSTPVTSAADTVSAPLTGVLVSSPEPPLPIASAQAVDGTVYVARAGGRWQLLARGSSLYVGDTLSTSQHSTITVQFTDGGTKLVRPESTVVVTAYNFAPDEPHSDAMTVRLLKGGFRSLTGAIGKRGDRDAYKLIAGTAVVGVLGTDYTVRICQNDCEIEATGPGARPAVAAKPNIPQVLAARLLQLRGSLFAIRADNRLALAEGAAIYPRDILETGPDSTAVVLFRDDTRVSMNPSSQLVVSRFQFNAAAQQQGSMAVNALKGGLRAATGAVAKAAPQNVRFSTATATVGIRGTQFDMACGPAGAGVNPESESLVGQNCDQSLYVFTRLGEVFMRDAQGREVDLPAGKSGYAADSSTGPQVLDNPPAFMLSPQAPAPEGFNVNLQQVFGAALSGDGTEPGIYLSVRDGSVSLSQAGERVVLETGESAYAALGGLVPSRLESPPPIINTDPFTADRMLNFNICRR